MQHVIGYTQDDIFRLCHDCIEECLLQDAAKINGVDGVTADDLSFDLSITNAGLFAIVSHSDGRTHLHVAK